MAKNFIKRIFLLLETPQKIRYYLITIVSLFLLAIIISFLLSMSSMNYEISSINKTEVLKKAYDNYSQNQIPELSNSFYQIFWKNLSSALLVLWVPIIVFFLLVYSLRIPLVAALIKKDSDPQSLKKTIMIEIKILILILTLNYYVNTLAMKNIFEYFSITPPDLAILTYTHGIFEFPAMMIPSIVSLYTIDKIFDISNNRSSEEKTKIQFYQLLKILLVVVLILISLLIIAAYIECYITPGLIQQTLEKYVL
jgi:uncharacterized membrane protein SpoIIM required for sporulation